MTLHTLCISLRQAASTALASLLLLHGQVQGAAGTVESIVGTGRIIQSHGQERPAIKGDNFYDGDTLVTAANSNMKLRMLDDAQIWLRPDTRLKVEKYTATQRGGARDEARLQLITGSLREVTGTIGKASPADYRLATPNATIGIRGTDFDAVFVSPQAAAQMNTQPGTYNRVYAGSTALSGPAGQIILATGQAGFMGLAANSQPQVLPAIPPFLNNPTPPASTGASGRSLQITVRTGDAPGMGGSNTISSSQAGAAAPTEQRVRVTEGERAQISLALGTAPGRPAGGRPASQMAMEVMATLNGSQAQVQLRMQSQAGGPGGGRAEALSTTVNTALGSWTEISSRVSGAGNGNAVVSSGGSADTRVFLRVDEVGR